MKLTGLQVTSGEAACEALTSEEGRHLQQSRQLAADTFGFQENVVYFWGANSWSDPKGAASEQPM